MTINKLINFSEEMTAVLCVTPMKIRMGFLNSGLTGEKESAGEGRAQCNGSPTFSLVLPNGISAWMGSRDIFLNLQSTEKYLISATLLISKGVGGLMMDIDGVVLMTQTQNLMLCGISGVWCLGISIF